MAESKSPKKVSLSRKAASDAPVEETSPKTSADDASVSEKPKQASYISGVFPNRDMDSAPDIEQLKRQQARQEHDFVLGKTDERPALTRKTYSLSEELDLPDSNRKPSQAKADGQYL